jgi:hypothetical protein
MVGYHHLARRSREPGWRRGAGDRGGDMSLRSRLTLRGLAFGVVLTLSPEATAGQAAKEAPRPPEQIVRQWFEAINRLGSDQAAIDTFVSLYAPTALHITGPTEDQRGTATYRGPEGLRVLAARLAETQDRPAYRIETETAREETVQLFHTAKGPWGDASVGVQFVAVYTDKKSAKRYVVPGAAFFQLTGGQIRRARVYLASDERSEVEREPTRKRGG